MCRCSINRQRRVLLHHQMLHAMHLTFRRHAFRPQAPEVLGTGFRWAFEGEAGPLVLRGPDGRVDPATITGMPEFLRKANQLTEMMLLAGPGDEEIGELREHYGYRPEAMDEVEADRLKWEASYVDILAEYPASKAELRVRLQARELLHEHQATPRVIAVALAGDLRRKRRAVTFVVIGPCPAAGCTSAMCATLRPDRSGNVTARRRTLSNCPGCWDMMAQNGIAPGIFTADSNGGHKFTSIPRPAAEQKDTSAV